MADEIQFMHEELTNLTSEIQAGIDELKKNSKRMTPDVRNQKVSYCALANALQVESFPLKTVIDK